MLCKVKGPELILAWFNPAWINPQETPAQFATRLMLLRRGYLKREEKERLVQSLIGIYSNEDLSRQLYLRNNGRTDWPCYAGQIRAYFNDAWRRLGQPNPFFKPDGLPQVTAEEIIPLEVLLRRLLRQIALDHIMLRNDPFFDPEMVLHFATLFSARSGTEKSFDLLLKQAAVTVEWMQKN